MRLLWKMYPQAAFFEVYVPAKGTGAVHDLPLIVESTESRLVEPYTKMFYRLFTERDTPLFRILFMNVNCDPSISRRVAANLAITLASEDLVTYLVDLDMKEPALHDVFHVDRNPGMVEYLLKGTDAEDVIRDTGVPELKFIPSGRLLTDPDDVLSVLGWSSTLDRLIPPGVVGLIYAGTGKGFDLSELMPEVDGVLLLFSSGEKINRWVRKELRKVKRKSDVVGVIWTNPLEYPFKKVQPQYVEESGGVDETVPEEETVSVVSRGESFMEKDGHAEDVAADAEPDVGSGESGVAGGNEREDESSGGTGGGEEVEREELGEQVAEAVGAGIEGGEANSAERESEVATGRRSWIVLLIVIPLLFVGWVMYNQGVFSPVEPGRDAATSQVGSEASSAGGFDGTEAAPESPSASTGQVAENVMGSPSRQVKPLPYSLVLASYKNQAAAEKGRMALQEAGFDAYLVPVEITGIGRWTRLMTGYYSEKSEAETILEEISVRSEFTEGRVISSRLSCLLGEFDSMEGAEEARKMIEEPGLDPYTIWSGGEEGPFYLYVGAFENERQSVVVEELLAEKDIKCKLIAREGFHP